MFTAFVLYSTRLTIVYAGFAFVVAALLWTYSGWLILLGRRATVVLRAESTYLRLGLQQLRLSSVELEQLGAETDVLRGPRTCRRRTALERESPRHGARTAGHRGWRRWPRRSSAAGC